MTPSEVQTQKSTIGRAHPIQLVNRGLSAIAPGLAAMAAEQLFVTVFRHKTPLREEAWAREAMKISIPSPRGELAAWVWGSGPKTALLVHGWAGRGLQSHESEELVRALSNGTLHMTQGLGHRRILRDPAVVDVATTFINRVELRDLVEPGSNRTWAVSAA